MFIRDARPMLASSLLLTAVLTLTATLKPNPVSAQDTTTEKPNIVVLFADDLGYGDIGPFGHPTIRTPHLDRMAAEGMKMTQFYAAASVCTPSRAALLTGRLPVRSGMASDEVRVLFPQSRGGIPESEVLLSEALREQGYATGAFGKWHLGHRKQYLPTNNGFDAYLGVPYSNDMRRADRGHPPLPLIRNAEIIEQPVEQHDLTKRYTEAAVDFIRQNDDQPFFVYLPYTFPHVPLYASDQFRGTSRRGLYGDVVEEIDWSVGQILQVLRERGLAENTFVFFTSDNGPWLVKDENGGTSGLLKWGKGTTWEGGMREPTLAWWPGTIEGGSVSMGIASTMDIYTTAVELAGGQVPQDRIVDGVNLMPQLTGEKESVREVMYYYRGERLFAVRKGPWKAHFITQTAYRGDEPEHHDPPQLYHLEHDPGERFNLAEEHPDIIRNIEQLVDRHRANLKRGKDVLDTIGDAGESWVYPEGWER